MKLAGIRSSKRRRATYERNQELRSPSGPMLTGHNPIPQPNGALKCSGCAGVYSPGAFARHLAGGLLDAHNGTFTTGPGDPWLTRPELQQQAIEDADAAIRAEQVEKFYEEQRRPRQRVADGVSKSAFFD